jgi:hypothetical protein
VAGFGDNSAMLHADADRASQILSAYLTGENTDQQKQSQLTLIAVSLLVAAILVRSIK